MELITKTLGNCKEIASKTTKTFWILIFEFFPTSMSIPDFFHVKMCIHRSTKHSGHQIHSLLTLSNFPISGVGQKFGKKNYINF